MPRMRVCLLQRRTKDGRRLSWGVARGSPMSRVAHRSCGAPRNRAARSRHCPHPKPTRSERDGDDSRRQLPPATSTSLPWTCKRGSYRWTRRHHALAYTDGLEFPCRPFYFRVPIPWVPGQVSLVRQMPFLSDVYTTLHHEMHTLLAQFPPRCEVCLEPGDQLGHVDQSTCPAFQGAPLLYSFHRYARPPDHFPKTTR